MPLLQPLALSAATRHAIARHDGLLAETRSAAAAASGLSGQPLARLQRVRPRTLLAIAAAAGAFYFILPQLAQVSSSWHALQSAHWAWLPVIIAASALTYLASAAALIGAVPGPVPFWPATLTQAASSFVNRVSPANVGGMALNARFLQKYGVPPGAGVAAVGVNALMGAVAHLILLVIFFTLAGHRMAQAFKLPPASKLLLILAVAAALTGIVLATRRGRRFAATRLLPGLRSAAASLRTVAASPVKLTLLAGGSALITLAYIGGLAASVQAFGGGRRDHRDRRRLPRRRPHRRRLPHPRRPRRHRSRPGRRPDRHRRAPRARRLSGPHLPARHLLAARPTRMGLPADPAKARLHMTPGSQALEDGHVGLAAALAYGDHASGIARLPCKMLEHVLF